MASVPSKTIRRRGLGVVLATIGFILSPLSWWNDLFVNVPLALGFAWLISWFHPSAFGVSFVVGYWLTNVLGLVLMHKGAAALAAKDARLSYGRWELGKDLLIALLYTGFIVALVKLRWLAPLPEYLKE